MFKVERKSRRHWYSLPCSPHVHVPEIRPPPSSVDNSLAYDRRRNVETEIGGRRKYIIGALAVYGIDCSVGSKRQLHELYDFDSFTAKPFHEQNALPDTLSRFDTPIHNITNKSHHQCKP